MAEHRTNLKSLFDISEKIRQSVERTNTNQKKVTVSTEETIKSYKKLNKTISTDLHVRKSSYRQSSLQAKVMSQYHRREISNVKDLIRLERNRNTALASRLKYIESSLKKTVHGVKAGRESVKTIKSANTEFRLMRQIFAGMSAYNLFMRLKNNVASAIKEVVDLQVKISEIRTISQETQLSQEKWLTSVQNLSIKYAHSTGDITSGIYQTISNQIAKGREAISFMGDALAFANVTGATSADSVGLLTTGLNAYSKSIAATQQVAASYYKTIELGRVRAEEMASTIGRTAPLASVLGVRLNELNAAIATMTIQGQPVNVSTTLLRGIMLKLIKPTKSMKNLLKEWGYESGEAAVKTIGFVNVIRRLNDEALRGGQARIGELFGRERPMTGMATLAKNNLHDYEKTLEKFKSADKDYSNAMRIATESNAFYLKQTWRELGVFYQREFAEPIVKSSADFLRMYRSYDKDLKITATSLKHIGLYMLTWYTYSKYIKLETAKQLALEQGIAVTKTRSLATMGSMAVKVGLITLAVEALYTVMQRNLARTATLEKHYQSILGTVNDQKGAEDKLNKTHVKRLDLIKEEHRLRSNTIIEDYNDEIRKIDIMSKHFKDMYKSTSLTAEDSLKRFFKVLDSHVSTLKRNVTSLKAGLKNVAKSAEAIKLGVSERKFSSIEKAELAKVKTRRLKLINTVTGGLETPYSRVKSRKAIKIAKAEPTYTLEQKEREMLKIINLQIKRVNANYNKAILSGSVDMLKKAQSNLGVVRKWVERLKGIGFNRSRINLMQAKIDNAQLAAEAQYGKTAQKKLNIKKSRLAQLQKDKLDVQSWIKERVLLQKRIAKAGPDTTDLKERQTSLDAEMRAKGTAYQKSREALDELRLAKPKDAEGELKWRTEYNKLKIDVEKKRLAFETSAKATKTPYVSDDVKRYDLLGSKITEKMSSLYGPMASSTLSWQSKNSEIQSIVKTWTSANANLATLLKNISSGERLKDVKQTERAQKQRVAETTKSSSLAYEKERFRIEKELRKTKAEFDEKINKFKSGMAYSETALKFSWLLGRREAAERVQAPDLPIRGKGDWAKQRRGVLESGATYRGAFEEDFLREGAGQARIEFSKAEDLRIQYQRLEIQLKKLNEKQSVDSSLIRGGTLPTIKEPKETKVEITFNDKRFADFFTIKVVEKIERNRRLTA